MRGRRQIGGEEQERHLVGRRVQSAHTAPGVPATWGYIDKKDRVGHTVVFVLNNSGYLIERLLRNDPNIEYKRHRLRRYAELPHASGCDDWFTARVSTCGEFDQALQRASRGDTAAYIEVVTETYAASPCR
jgi:hypothetical protein